MWLLIIYIVLGVAWLWAAYDASDGSIAGFAFNVAALIFGLFLMVGIEKIVGFFFDGAVGSFCNFMSRYDNQQTDTSQKEYIEHVDGEVVGEENYPPLCAVNPTHSSKRIANKKTYNGSGGVFFAQPMWCDVCRHNSIHAYIDGAWACQAPTHHS